MDNPKKIIDFIEKNNLGYILGNAVRAIVHSCDYTPIESGMEAFQKERLQHLKDARAFLNIEIRRLTRSPKK